MLDSNLRQKYQKICVDPVIKNEFFAHINPIFVTFLALLFGFFSAFFIYMHIKYIAVILLILSGYLDTLDGSIARMYNKKTDKGASLDIIFDRFVEFFIILGIYLYDPSNRALICLLMLGSAYICITSFLIVGILIDKKTEKSFYYSPGIMERTEVFILFIFMIIFPSFFSYLGISFSVLLFLTGLLRIFQFYKSDETV